MPTPKGGYRVDGKRVPSVTTVLGVLSMTPTDALCQWAANLAREDKDWREERNRAGQIGTAVHDALEHWPSPPERPEWMSDDEWARLEKAFADHGEWWTRQRPSILLQEVQLTSKELMVGGTPDLVVRIRGQAYLLDHKTSKRLDGKVVAQVAAYAHMLKEVNQVEVAGAIVLHHSVEFGFAAVPLAPDTLARGLEVFRAARAIYDAIPVLKTALGPVEL